MLVRRIITGTTALAATVAIAACGSSGGGSDVSTSQLENKLKNEPQLKSALSTVGTKAGGADKIVACIAKAFKNEADPDDLKKYVDGKINAADISGKDKSADSDVKTEIQTCVKSAVQGASSSPTG